MKKRLVLLLLVVFLIGATSEYVVNKAVSIGNFKIIADDTGTFLTFQDVLTATPQFVFSVGTFRNADNIKTLPACDVNSIGTLVVYDNSSEVSLCGCIFNGASYAWEKIHSSGVCL